MPTKQAAKNVWTDEERAAMQASARERKAASKRSPEEERAAGAKESSPKIAEMPEPRPIDGAADPRARHGQRPTLVPRTYYGMPAYAKDGKTICFFKPTSKFKVRYSTFGFQPDAKLDDGDMWPVAFAVTKLTPAWRSRSPTS